MNRKPRQSRPVTKPGSPQHAQALAAANLAAVKHGPGSLEARIARRVAEKVAARAAASEQGE